MDSDNANSMLKSKSALPKRSLLLLGVLALMAAFMVCLSVGSASAAGPTYVYEDITTDTTWDEAGSPYYVNASFAVSEGATLTIGPNVTVLCDDGVVITVDGALDVNGNATHMVDFDANATAWYGFVLNQGSTANIDYAYINNTVGAFDIFDADLTMTNSQLYNTDAWWSTPITAVFVQGGSLVIDGCYIDAYWDPDYVIYVYMDVFADGVYNNVTAADVTITNTEIISECDTYTLYIYRYAEAEDNATATFDSDVLISGNIIDQTHMGTDYIYIYTLMYAYDNSTVMFVGDTVIEDNEMTGYGDDTAYMDTRVFVRGENSTAQVIGDILINNNRIEVCEYGPYVYLWLNAESYGEISSVGDVFMNGNSIEGAYNDGLYYYCGINAEDNSVVSSVGDVFMNENSLDYAEAAFEAYWYAYYVYDNATVSVIANLSIEGNYVDAAEYAFDVEAEAYDVYQDGMVSIQIDMAILNNVVNGTLYDVLYANLEGYAADRSSIYVDASLRFEGNEVSCYNNDGEPAVTITRWASASVDAECTVNVEVCVLDNIIDVYTHGAIYVNDYAMADDEATAELSGLVTISGNVVVASMPIAPSAPEDQYAGIIVERNFDLGVNGTVVFASDVMVENNDITGADYGVFIRVKDETISNVENTTLEYSSDLMVRGNSFTACYESAVSYVIRLDAYGYAEVMFDGAATFEDNIVEYADVYAFDLRPRFTTEDFGEIYADIPVCLSGNTVTDAKGLLRYDGEYEADEESVLEIVGDVCVLDNVCDELDANMVRFAVECDVDEMASVLIENALTVDGNTALLEDDAVNYVIEIYVSESAIFEAVMPLTVTCNTFEVAGSMVNAEVHCSVWENATAVLSNDVLVQGNSMDARYFLFEVGAPTGPVEYNGYGLKLFQYLNVDADEVLASGLIESAVLFDGNTIDGYGLVGMNVYRYADAEADYNADAVACIVGDVTATNNVLNISGFGCGLAGGAETYAYSSWGNASATVDTLFCFSQNTLYMENGHGIVAYAEYNNENYEGDYYGYIGILALEYVIENNCIYGVWNVFDAPTAPGDLYGIYVDVPIDVPVLVTGNAIEMVTGTGIIVQNGDVLIEDNEVVVESGYGIVLNGGDVIVRNNFIQVGGTGISVYADGAVIVDNVIENVRGVGLYLEADDLLIEDFVITGAETGIVAEDCVNLTVRNGMVVENDYGLVVEECDDSVFYCIEAIRNNFDGARFEDCMNLNVFDCAFSYNGRDGAVFDDFEWDVVAVVGNCSFEENWDDGLFIEDCYGLVIYNGIYANNGDDGITVYEDEYSFDQSVIVWIVDGDSEVINNAVYFIGKVYVLDGGELTLDHVYFALGGWSAYDDAVPIEFADHLGEIEVMEGGKLVARGVEFDTLTYFVDYPYLFNVNGCLDMMDCSIYGAVELYLGPTSEAELSTTTIMQNERNGIFIDGCAPVIRSCVISGNYMDGIVIVDASPIIKQCLIVGNERGIYAYDSCLDKVIDNIFLSNYAAGIYAENVEGVIHDNVFLFNERELFLVNCDVSVVANEIGYARLLEAQEPYASAIATVIMDLVKVNIGNGYAYAPSGPSYYNLMDEVEYFAGMILASTMSDNIGIYAVDSHVVASDNSYGMLQYAVYAIDSHIEFSDEVRQNSFDVTIADENGTRVISIPFYVYDGIYADNSYVVIKNAYFEVLDDAVFLEHCDATIADTVFEAGDFDIYIMDSTVLATHGCEYDRFMIEDESVIYVEHLLTLTVKDQDGFGIAGASVTITDSAGKVWAVGVSDGKGVFKAYLPSHALLANDAKNASINPYSVAVVKENATANGSIVMDDAATSAGVTLAMKKNTVFGMDPIVLGGIALVMVVVIVGALYFARKK